MSPIALLTVYCALIVLASLLGGLIPLVVRLTHQRMQIVVSFVSGVMLGVSLLHMLPHAVMERAHAIRASGGEVVIGHGLIAPLVGWLLVGFLLMFFIERFFCFHHHDAPAGQPRQAGHDHGPSRHDHRLTWTGAAVGLTAHSLVAGVALAAAVGAADGAAAWPAGLGTFLAIILHKPFDSMTLGALMALGRRSAGARHLINALFGMVVPAGVLLFVIGLRADDAAAAGVIASALAFSSGTFLCISLSDLLPELQFHQHDRAKLSAALLLGIAVAWGAQRLEAAGHKGQEAHLGAAVTDVRVRDGRFVPGGSGRGSVHETRVGAVRRGGQVVAAGNRASMPAH